MEKKIGLFIICLIVVCLSSSVVIALPPMGPPKALLGQDVWEIGIDYGHQAMDLEAVGKVTEIQVSPLFVTVRKAKHNLDDLKSNIVMGRIGYGINDNWDAYVRLGAADDRDHTDHGADRRVHHRECRDRDQDPDPPARELPRAHADEDREQVQQEEDDE